MADLVRRARRVLLDAEVPRLTADVETRFASLLRRVAERRACESTDLRCGRRTHEVREERDRESSSGDEKSPES